MKFKLNSNKYRYIKRFALLPIRIRYEVRWLEIVYILQKRDGPEDSWHNQGFQTKQQYLKREFEDPIYN